VKNSVSDLGFTILRVERTTIFHWEKNLNYHPRTFCKLGNVRKGSREVPYLNFAPSSLTEEKVLGG